MNYRKWEKIEILLSGIRHSAIPLELLKSSPFGENVIFFLQNKIKVF